jgi:hypothetical protein
MRTTNSKKIDARLGKNGSNNTTPLPLLNVQSVRVLENIAENKFVSVTCHQNPNASEDDGIETTAV